MSDNSSEVAAFLCELDGFVDRKDIRVALDVGSRDGLVALRLSGEFPESRVYAFECNPAAIEIARGNLNTADRVQLVEKAVCDSDGPITFYAIDTERTVTPHPDKNIGASSLYVANDSYPAETYVQKEISVQGTTLQTWAKTAGIDKVDLIWMDLQGSELRALKGMGRLLKSVTVIYCEVEYKEIYKGQPLAREVRRFLNQNGFTLIKRLNTSEWFGDELYVNRSQLSAFTLARVWAASATSKVWEVLRKAKRRVAG